MGADFDGKFHRHSWHSENCDTTRGDKGSSQRGSLSSWYIPGLKGAGRSGNLCGGVGRGGAAAE